MPNAPRESCLIEQIDEFEFFLEKPWSDGLPVVTPTEERINRMLLATGRDPDEIIGPIPPAVSYTHLTLPTKA